MSNRNDRSDAALQKRLELAKKATHGPWALWEWDNGVKEIRNNADPDEDHVCRVWHKKDGDFLAKNSPREVQADIEEILRLRQENERLREELKNRDEMLFRLIEEISSLERDLDFISLKQYILIEKLFNSRICHKAVLCEQENPKKWKFEGQGGCKNCWDEWARHLANDAIEEAELNAE